jgi:hypothetical protein
MKVTYYISELLFENDCVIVPGFGGFVSNFAPAKIHPVNHTFYPPSKSILFNSKLLSDDGLLLHTISMGESLTYDQAKQMVEEFTQDCLNKLSEGNSLKLERIGKIIKDEDGHFLFDPDITINYLEESFGLPSIMSPQISRNSMHKRIEKRFVDRHLHPDKIIKNKKMHWASVALIPVLLLIGWLTLNPVLDYKGSQRSGMMSVAEPEFNNTGFDNLESHLNPASVEPLSDDTHSEKIVTLDRTTESALPINLANDGIIPRGIKYYVIGGAFQSRENADKMLASMKSEGYLAEDVGQNPAGLYMVSYFSSADKSDALSNLSEIRRDKNPSAWLLKK